MVVEMKSIYCGEAAIISKPLDMNIFWYNHEACHRGKPTLKLGNNLSDIKSKTKSSASEA